MDGYEAARTIRRFEDRKKAAVPILAMTANAFADDVRDALRSGMDAHAAKPIQYCHYPEIQILIFYERHIFLLPKRVEAGILEQ